MNTTNGIVGHADILCLIEASSRANVNYASLNVTLTGTFLIEARDQRAQDGLHYSPINFSLRQLPQFLDINGSVVLEPSGFCLASSVEKIQLPDCYVFDILLHPEAARMGIRCELAGRDDQGRLKLAITNTLKHHSVRIRGGDSIVALRFYRIPDSSCSS